jgi:hypothetical protein
MKKVLVIYFTQSGQLNKAVKATLKNLETASDITVKYEQLKPVVPFPFPWTYMQFFDAFPETVQGIPCELESLSVDANENFDLIVIAYQPWFLSVSRPVDSFLQSQEARKLLNNKPVVTIIACRNMWLNAQEKMKARLKNVGAILQGNITYVDRSSNLTSLITVFAFALGGVQDRFLGIFPKYGVSDEELSSKGYRFGDVVLKHLKSGDYTNMQEELISSGAVNIKPNLMMMEGRGKILFPLYAAFILRKGKAKSRERRMRVRIFGIVLPILILLLSPLITVVSRLLPFVLRSKTKSEIDYFSHNRLR